MQPCRPGFVSPEPGRRLRRGEPSAQEELRDARVGENARGGILDAGPALFQHQAAIHIGLAHAQPRLGGDPRRPGRRGHPRHQRRARAVAQLQGRAARQPECLDEGAGFLSDPGYHLAITDHHVHLDAPADMAVTKTGLPRA